MWLQILWVSCESICGGTHSLLEGNNQIRRGNIFLLSIVQWICMGAKQGWLFFLSPLTNLPIRSSLISRFKFWTSLSWGSICELACIERYINWLLSRKENEILPFLPSLDIYPLHEKSLVIYFFTWITGLFLILRAREAKCSVETVSSTRALWWDAIHSNSWQTKYHTAKTCRHPRVRNLVLWILSIMVGKGHALPCLQW